MKPRKIPRRSLFDSLAESGRENAFCHRDDLTNEASVEAFFVNRLLGDLGYKDNQIKTKKSISEVVVSLGAKQIKYKPDYVMIFRRTPRWVLDAKSPSERIEDWVPQCSGYCLALNQKYRTSNPVEYFVLSNGLRTNVYKWDVESPLLELDFTDFYVGNPTFEKFRSLLSSTQLRKDKRVLSVEGQGFLFRRPTPEFAKQLFAQCHRIIWKSEVCSPTSAFMEFTKLMFVKLWSDRQLREDASTRVLLQADGEAHIPEAAVTFSSAWILNNESVTESPINDILFKTLRDEIEKDIAFRKKKRIFEKDEKIDLRPDTIKAVVRKLEHYDMFGIDEDLNGRLFETFLSATMRGAELGQFFTPRSIVKLMVRLADLKVSNTRFDRVVDACCGTGGFLIEAMAEMRNRVRDNKGLSDVEKKSALERLSNEAFYGIDFGKNPPIARIARINMYLHGDGGSRIYYVDALDKELLQLKGQSAEVLENQEELKRAWHDGLSYDVALTNPPFSMTKELKNESEARILRQYDLARVAGTNRIRPSLRSSAMFLERYRDILRPGGYLFTVIDDTLLASVDFGFVREFIRRNFFVRGIISLHGDAFRQSGARVKTSVLCLEKKDTPSDQQADAFYAFSQALGVDDLTPRSSADQVAAARARGEEEIGRIVADFRAFLSGDPNAPTVDPVRIADRLDLKHVVPLKGRYVKKWKRSGLEVKSLGDIAKPVVDPVNPHDTPDTEYRLLYVTYDGRCTIQRRLLGKYIKPDEMLRVQAGDLLFSNIRATDGAIGIVPPELDGSLVSHSFTVLRCSSREDTVYLWAVIRSYEIRADIMSDSTGTGRYNTDWDLAAPVQVPWMPKVQREAIANRYIKAWEMEKAALEATKDAEGVINSTDLNSEDSRARFDSYKPPK